MSQQRSVGASQRLLRPPEAAAEAVLHRRLLRRELALRVVLRRAPREARARIEEVVEHVARVELEADRVDEGGGEGELGRPLDDRREGGGAEGVREEGRPLAVGAWRESISRIAWTSSCGSGGRFVSREGGERGERAVREDGDEDVAVAGRRRSCTSRSAYGSSPPTPWRRTSGGCDGGASADAAPRGARCQ